MNFWTFLHFQGVLNYDIEGANNHPFDTLSVQERTNVNINV